MSGTDPNTFVLRSDAHFVSTSETAGAGSKALSERREGRRLGCCAGCGSWGAACSGQPAATALSGSVSTPSASPTLQKLLSGGPGLPEVVFSCFDLENKVSPATVKRKSEGKQSCFV